MKMKKKMMTVRTIRFGRRLRLKSEREPRRRAASERYKNCVDPKQLEPVPYARPHPRAAQHIVSTPFSSRQQGRRGYLSVNESDARRSVGTPRERLARGASLTCVGCL